jgi:predicted acyltransferase
MWLRTQRTLSERIIGIAVAGLSGVLFGALWNVTFPINKKLWTSSYVLFAGGLSLMLLALSLWIVDLPGKDPDKSRQSRFLEPFLVFGSNAISAYIFSELLQSGLSAIHLHPGLNVQQWLYRCILRVVPNAPFASLLYSLAFVFVCWLATSVLYRRRIFIKV